MEGQDDKIAELEGKLAKSEELLDAALSTIKDQEKDIEEGARQVKSQQVEIESLRAALENISQRGE